MQATQSAEYKQVTVLFADVVHSMDIAAAVGAERLREIMAELLDRCAAVVTRYGGRSSSSPATGSWRCSARRWRWRIMLFVPVGRRWQSRRRPSGLPSSVQDRDGMELQAAGRVELGSGDRR